MIYCQNLGTRRYKINDYTSIDLRQEQQLFLEGIPVELKADSKFVGILLEIVFGKEILAISNITGVGSNACTNNVLKKKLDPIKLNFIKSMFLFCICSLIK